jgi:hypothetical protein
MVDGQDTPDREDPEGVAEGWDNDGRDELGTKEN